MDAKQFDIIKAFLRDETGATSIEYALVASLVSVAVIGGVRALGSANENMYDNLRTTIIGAGVG